MGPSMQYLITYFLKEEYRFLVLTENSVSQRTGGLKSCARFRAVTRPPKRCVRRNESIKMYKEEINTFIKPKETRYIKIVIILKPLERVLCT